jgi:hypothetical protein
MIKLEFESMEELQAFLNVSQPTHAEMRKLVESLSSQRIRLQNELDIARDQAQVVMSCENIEDNAELDGVVTALQTIAAKQHEKIEELRELVDADHQRLISMNNALQVLLTKIEYLEVQSLQMQKQAKFCCAEPEPCKLHRYDDLSDLGFDLSDLGHEIASCKEAILKAAADTGLFARPEDVIVLQCQRGRYSVVLLARAWDTPEKVGDKDDISMEYRVTLCDMYGKNVGWQSNSLRSREFDPPTTIVSISTHRMKEIVAVDELIYLITESSHDLLLDMHYFNTIHGLDDINEALKILNERSQD